MSKEKNICRRCNGKGEITCPGCEGSGKLEQLKENRREEAPKIVSCAGCNGRGIRTCGSCGGTGVK